MEDEIKGKGWTPMKILIINVVCGIRSTGRICTDLAEELDAQGHEVKIAYGRDTVSEKFSKYAVRIGSDIDVKLHGIKARLLDASGFGSKKATYRFIKWVEMYDPELIHLHNIHGYYLNIDILFQYLKSCHKKIVWTLHDCWSFTGHSAFCDAVKCERWRTGCYACPQRKEYPKSFIDCSERNWVKKKNIFTGVKNLTLITPSDWLANLVHNSFLSEYPIHVIHNGVDTSKFYPLVNDFRSVYNLKDKIIILGVASVWSDLKGLSDFIRLSEMLDSKYQIVMVGLNEKQRKDIPSKILSLPKTDSTKELAYIYSSADIFVNLTYCDISSMVNLEASACGLPIVTYATGGCKETLENVEGYAVERGNLEAVKKKIEDLYRNGICDKKKNRKINKPHDKKSELMYYMKIVYKDNSSVGGGYFEMRKKMGLQGRICLLGVAAVWESRKGLEDFNELYKKLNGKVSMILVGLTQKQKSRLSKGIIGLKRTNNIEELRKLYSVADVFINLTTDDNYPTTNLEAIACGTPVITYDTGGSAESAEMYGSVIAEKNLECIKDCIEKIGKVKMKKTISGIKEMVDEYGLIYFGLH